MGIGKAGNKSVPSKSTDDNLAVPLYEDREQFENTSGIVLTRPEEIAQIPKV